jgi:hypothetical protein
MTDTRWLPAEEAAERLGLTEEEVARLLLSGALVFRVRKRSPGKRVVLFTDVEVDAATVAAVRESRWGDPLSARVRADDLTNRAVLKFGKHPTRTSPGVRGRRRAMNGHDLADSSERTGECR